MKVRAIEINPSRRWQRVSQLKTDSTADREQIHILASLKLRAPTASLLDD